MDIELSFYQSSDELLDRLFERKFEVDLLFIDIQIREKSTELNLPVNPRGSC